MHTKKLLSFAFIAGFLMLLTGCGGAKTTDVVPTDGITVEDTTTVENTTTTPTETRDLTEKECIELVAYAMKAAQYQALGDDANFKIRAQKTADLQIQYKMNDAEYEASCAVLMTNMNFMQTIQARMKELK